MTVSVRLAVGRKVFTYTLLELIATGTGLAKVMIASGAVSLVSMVLQVKLLADDISIVVRVDFTFLVRKCHAIRLGELLGAAVLLALVRLVITFRFERETLLLRRDAAQISRQVQQVDWVHVIDHSLTLSILATETGDFPSEIFEKPVLFIAVVAFCSCSAASLPIS